MEKKLKRNQQEKMIAGVCAGLADYFDVDVTWIRIAFVLAVFAGMSGVLAYIVLWIAVPSRHYGESYGRFDTDYQVYEPSSGTPHPDQDFSRMPPRRPCGNGNGRLVFGLLFIIFGAIFLLDEFGFVPYWFEVYKLWPLVFIVPGILMILNANKRSRKEEWKEKQRAGRREESAEKTPVNDEDKSADTDQNNEL